MAAAGGLTFRGRSGVRSAWATTGSCSPCRGESPGLSQKGPLCFRCPDQSPGAGDRGRALGHPRAGARQGALLWALLQKTQADGVYRPGVRGLSGRPGGSAVCGCRGSARHWKGRAFLVRLGVLCFGCCWFMALKPRVLPTQHGGRTQGFRHRLRRVPGTLPHSHLCVVPSPPSGWEPGQRVSAGCSRVGTRAVSARDNTPLSASLPHVHAEARNSTPNTRLRMHTRSHMHVLSVTRSCTHASARPQLSGQCHGPLLVGVWLSLCLSVLDPRAGFSPIPGEGAQEP